MKFLLSSGAYDTNYKIYPFQESLITVAEDREFQEIAQLLRAYHNDPSVWKFKGDNGEILYRRSHQELEFQESVNGGDYRKTEQLLKLNPRLATDETFFWGEGVLLMPAKRGNKELVQLLLNYGAKVPDVLKWAQFYYFEREDMAAFLLEQGMNPNVMSWHHVTLLHDMAQKGSVAKTELLVRNGAEIDPIDEEYQSTPLGMAARWGNAEIAEYLLAQGADPNKSRALWSEPLAWAKKKGHAEIEHMLVKAGAR